MTILDKLAAHAEARVAAAREITSLDEIKERALALPEGGFEFERALGREGLSFICECKKASPSKGIISADFPYLDIAREYQAAGADCISVLTEPKWFLGSERYLKEIAAEVSIPCLRKDFTVHEYMIYEAKLLGASAVLLICSILSADRLARYLAVCEELGLSALVEAHNADEIRTAVSAGARVIGVNNRDLSDFSVDHDNSRRLRELVPQGTLFVSESGIRSREDTARLEQIGANAVLVGEALVRADSIRAKLCELRGEPS